MYFKIDYEQVSDLGEFLKLKSEELDGLYKDIIDICDKIDENYITEDSVIVTDKFRRYLNTFIKENYLLKAGGISLRKSSSLYSNQEIEWANNVIKANKLIKSHNMKEVNGVLLNFDNLLILRDQVEKKIIDISSCYDSIKRKLPIIDGTNNAFQGEDQRIYYDAFEMITDTYEFNVDKLKEIHKYLCDAIDSYEEEEKGREKNIDKNSENLSV